MTPYYQDSAVTIYHGDCRDVLPLLDLADLLLTDPPYGIAYNPTGGNGVARRGNLPRIIGDDLPFDPTPLLDHPKVILWGGNHYADKLPASPSWLVWYKRDQLPSIDFSDCELAWSNLGTPARVFNHQWHGMLRASERGQLRYYSTQKPLALMRWCLTLAGDVRTVCDPYCGSGSTLRAAKDMGIKAIGIDIVEQACEIAAQRMAQEVLAFGNEVESDVELTA